MFQKETLKSKSFWLSAAAVVGGIVLCTLGQTKEGVAAIGGGLYGMFNRDAIAKTAKK